MKCPNCNEQITEIKRWETVSVEYTFNLETLDSEQTDTEGGEFETYQCPNCDNDITDHEIIEKLDSILYAGGEL